MNDAPSQRNLLHRQRRSLVRRLSTMLETPMLILSFIWLVLMIIEFTEGLSPQLESANQIIWGAFVAQFVLELWIAPGKLEYLRTHWLTALALLLPALRLFRVVRALRVLRTAQAARGLRLVRWLSSINRGIKATQRTMKERGLRYVLALTLVIDFVGAAGIYFFENPRALAEAGLISRGQPVGITSYGEGLWWTSMMLTTMGSDYFPKSTEGRIIALLLAIYAFAIFGYITATVASVIIRVDERKAAQTSAARPA